MRLYEYNRGVAAQYGNGLNQKSYMNTILEMDGHMDNAYNNSEMRTDSGKLEFSYKIRKPASVCLAI